MAENERAGKLVVKRELSSAGFLMTMTTIRFPYR